MVPTALVDADGDALANAQSDSRGLRVKRLLFDWSGIVAAVGMGMTWATLASNVGTNSREIERLRLAGEKRAESDVRLAETMATKTDVQQLSTQVQELAAEIRNARSAR